MNLTFISKKWINYLKKKQTPRGQEDSVLGNFERHSILEPDDVRLGDAFSFAVDGDWIVARHCRVNGMFNNSWNLEGCKETQKRVHNELSCLGYPLLPRLPPPPQI